jgi:Tfp pilus assembly protein PilV
MEVLLRIVRKNQAGQSMIEMVAALGVIMIVLMSMATVGIAAVRNSELSRNKSLAVKYAEEGMEKIRAYRDNPNTTWTTFNASCANQSSIGLVAPPPPFTQTITCDTSNVNLAVVVIKIKWTDSKNIEHSSILQSNFSNKQSW